MPLQCVSELATITPPCHHAVALAKALGLGELLQPNPAGCQRLREIASAAEEELLPTVSPDGAIIVPLQLPAGTSVAVRCPDDLCDTDWGLVSMGSEGSARCACLDVGGRLWDGPRGRVATARTPNSHA